MLAEQWVRAEGKARTRLDKALNEGRTWMKVELDEGGTGRRWNWTKVELDEGGTGRRWNQMKMELDSRISGYRCSTWPRGEVRVSRTARMAAAVAVLLIMCVPASALAQVSGLQIGMGVRGGGATLIPNSQIDSHTTGGFGFAAAVTVELLDRIAFGPAATMYYSAHDFGEDVELDAIPAAVGLWVRVKTIELLTIGAHLTYTFPNLVIETNGEETHTGGAGVGAGIDALFAFQVGDNWLYSTFIEVGPYLTWCHFLEDVPYTPAINYFAYGLTVHITLDLEFD